MRTRATAAALLALLTLLAATTAIAADEEVSIPQQAVLLLKILKFNRSLEARAGDTATIAVLYLENDPESETVRTEVLTALDQASRTVSFPIPVKIARLAYSSSRLDADLAAMKPVAVYVTPGLAAQIGNISKATRKEGVLTFSSSEADVRAGLSIGLVVRESRPALLVNLPASRAEGADLSSDLLRLSEVIR